MAFLAIFALCTTALFSAFWYFIRWNEAKTKAEFAKRMIRYIPQPNTFVQSIKKERLEESRHEIIKREGKTFGFSFLNIYTILCAEPEIAQLVFSKEFTNFTNRRPFITDDPLFKNSLGSCRDEQWKRLRAVVTPTFSAGKLRRMKPCIDDTIYTLIKNLDSAVASSRLVNIKQAFGAFTMDTIIQVAFGIKVDSLVDQNNPTILHAQKLFSQDMTMTNLFKFTMIMMAPKVANFFKLQINSDVTSYFNRFANQIIKQKKEAMSMDTFGKANNFIELLLEVELEEEQELVKGQVNGHENGNEFKKTAKFITNEEIITQCIFFFIAGYDTTASAITMGSYLLATNPDVQEKLYQEIVSVISKLTQESGLDGPKNPVELVTHDSLSRFSYLNAVIDETLRLYSPVTFVERQAFKDIFLQTEDGKLKMFVKKGDMIHFPIYSMHRDPEQFPDPESFKPERFIGEAKHHKYSYIPFGSGPRNCVAKSLALIEAKLALLHTVRLYKLSVAKETKIPPEFNYQTQAIIPKEVLLNVDKR